MMWLWIGNTLLNTAIANDGNITETGTDVDNSTQEIVDTSSAMIPKQDTVTIIPDIDVLF